MSEKTIEQKVNLYSGSFSEIPESRLFINPNTTDPFANPLGDKKFLVRIVCGKGVNLHIHDREKKRALHIIRADQYKLLQLLINYVTENGHYRIFKSYYRPTDHIFFNNSWEMMLSAMQIVNLLYITRRNSRAYTLHKIMEFVTAIN